VACERDHDFRLDGSFLCGDVTGGFHYGGHLHDGDFGHGETESYSAETEHRVELVEFLYAFEEAADGFDLGRFRVSDF